MGRRRIVKIESTKDVVDWIFDVSIDLSIKSKPRVAFLSGLGRSYYPGDPGFSKFGLVYQMNLDDTPSCTYTPPDERIQRPISSKGFGIDGLSAPRFRSNAKATNPSPDKYQRELCEPLLNPHRVKVSPEDDIYQIPPTDPYMLKKQLTDKRQLDHQCHIGFGRVRSLPRFGNPPVFNVAGVGSYHVEQTGSSTPYANASFGRSPMLYKPSTDVKCVYEKDELCIECGRVLKISDFYRTRFSVRVPLPETRHPTELPEDFPTGLHHVNLCNICYYRATLGKSKNWQKHKVKWMFKKTRTCSTIHDHQSLPELIQKTDCKTIRRLKMKESSLSRYFADRVEESIIVKV